MGLFKIRDVKESAPTGAVVVTDLDALIAEPVAFRFRGKTHIIKPLSTSGFLRFIEASNKIGFVIANKTNKPDEIIRAYHGIVSSVCDSFTIEDAKNMTEVQAWALLRTIVETVKGRSESEVQKKKIMSLSTLNP